MLPDLPELPTAFELVIDSDDPVAQADFGVVTRDTLTPDQTEGLSASEIDELVADELARNQATTLSELAAVSPGLIADAQATGRIDLGGWKLLSTAEAGDAQSSALQMLLESPDLTFTSAGDVKLLDAYTVGGKRGLPDDPNRWDRIWTQIRTALTITHPTRYGVVQVREVIDQPLVPGEPPPRPVVDESKPVISVIMIRDLGNLRLKPALVALGSLCIFGALCLFLHERDKLAWRQREAGAPAGT